MRRRTPVRARQERDYLGRAATFLICRECARCGGGSSEVHHRKGRRGDALLDEAWWVALCSTCHRWVTEHPKAALLAGWSVHRIGALLAVSFGCSDGCTLPPAHHGLHSFEPEVILP